MAFLGDDDQNVDKQPELIKLGDKEYKPEDLQGVLSKYEEVESFAKDHGGIDNLKKSFGNKAEAIGRLEQELEELKAKKALEQEESQPQEEKEKQAQVKAAVNLLKQEGGFISKDEFEQLYKQRRAADQLVEQVEELGKEINGSDGRPKFDPDEILKYMVETGINNPERAYKDKHSEQLEKWKEEQLSQGRSKGMATATDTSAIKQPKVEIPKNESGLRKRMIEFLESREASR